MTDIWFLFGAMAVDPALLDFIDQNCASFQRIGMLTHEVAPQPGKDPASMWITNPAAGYLQGDLDDFRRALRGKVGGAYQSAPIISLYAAGKVTQIWSTSSRKLSRAIKKFHDIYKGAAGATSLGTPTARLLGIMGACMVDDTFANAVADSTFELTPEGQAVMAEFGFDANNYQNDAEWQTLKKFVQDQNWSGVKGAQTELLSMTTWDCGCGERLMFYGNFKRAVN